MIRLADRLVLMLGRSGALAITLIDFAAKTDSLDVPSLRPAPSATVWHWLCDIRGAAERGEAADVARLAPTIAEKIDQAWCQ